MKHKRRLLQLSLFFLLCAACELLHPARVRLVSEQMPPTFEFKGGHQVMSVFFEGPLLPDKDGTVAPHDVVNPMHPNLVWAIYGPDRVTTLNEVPPIAYGQLPPGWEQDTPKTGAPPPLIDGMVYVVGANLDEGRWVRMCVVILDGKPQEYHGKYYGQDCDKK